MSLLDSLDDDDRTAEPSQAAELDLFGRPVVRPKRGRPPTATRRDGPHPAPVPHLPPVSTPPPPPPVVPAEPAVAFGAVTPLFTAQGAPYSPVLRAQQVGLGVVKTVVERLDAALAGAAVKLAESHLGPTRKAVVRQAVLAGVFPELYGDPIPPQVKPLAVITSRKAKKLLSDRLDALFASGQFETPHLTLSVADSADLLSFLQENILPERGSEL